MANDETTRKGQPAQPAQPAPPEDAPRKRRRKGYRGYPNNPSAGDVHFGSGFAGTGSTAGTGQAGLPAARVISERTKEDVDDET
jgi:hypothetical protein